jgi:hypothetical protein
MHAEALRACKDERIQEIRALENYAEALAAASHAIYKEKIYTLNDYFTVKEWISNESLRLAEELYCEHALELAMELNRRIESSSLSLPYKNPSASMVSAVIEKTLHGFSYESNLT